VAPALEFDVLTIFPTFFAEPLAVGVVGRALTSGLAAVRVHDLRAYADDGWRGIDDYPFGGGVGMVMKPEPFFRACDEITATYGRGWRVALSPSGRPLTHVGCGELVERRHLVLLCGRYKGMDQRVIDGLADEELSLGDFVLSGGEVAALAVIDATTRLLPGALGDEDSAATDSFATGLLDHPHYTRPRELRGMAVPEVLLSGNHAAIAAWRLEQAREKTRRVRPELLPGGAEE